MDTNYMVKWQGYCYNLRTKDWNYMQNRGVNSNWLYPVILNAWYIILFQAAAGVIFNFNQKWSRKMQ